MSNNKILYYSYGEVGTAFWDADGNSHGFHMNDQPFSDEYFRPLFEMIGVELVYCAKVPQNVIDDLQEIVFMDDEDDYNDNDSDNDEEE